MTSQTGTSIRRALFVTLAAVSAAACSPAQPAPTARPTATADVRLAAADRYLAALTLYDAAERPISTECLAAATLGALHRCWSDRLTAQHAFDVAALAITFPADMAADVGTLRYVASRLEGAIGGVARSANPSADRADLGTYSSASVDFLQISSNLREELGIITTPSP